LEQFPQLIWHQTLNDPHDTRLSNTPNETTSKSFRVRKRGVEAGNWTPWDSGSGRAAFTVRLMVMAVEKLPQEVRGRELPQVVHGDQDRIG
ncbi:hypothetical protein ABZT06_50255, partial [Streptomyces sp. NPDC005483]|uniref:hypothetical protein n=1 Tax=Streptomyces sp. NPDC005483 TaxID=3154882 RepID=UPI0033A95037